ncbi:TonB-dependent receptor [Sediminitomix flava]|uniref:Iron complex outermembrane receptor protein n=1 Tax=Sediminitomix flava TaxID=379075 RepID=A0A316A3D6_SEDFL|nr:TonB-dependent receptor [Sediminitomix flava]PWJ44237.1 iron complex outermembrane receptor protein [Sediminitomix flava]
MNTSRLNVLNSTVLRGTILLLMLCGNVRCWAANTAEAKTTNTFNTIESQIQGTVINELGEPMLGVAVTIHGTNTGTITDISGNFELSIPNFPSELNFSYIGYLPQSITIQAPTTNLQVQLQPDELKLDDVVVIGSRNANRALTETPVPVDVIALDEVTNSVGQVDLNQLLQFAVPSFNSNRQAGSDGADHIDAATLRGLGPDQVLLLVNGKRRHTSSYVNLLGTRGRGAVSTDLNTIPVAAIERIEVLRDGAAAQYGSDAIAGVINIVLKKDTETGSINTGMGLHQDGDGESLMVSGNYGWKLGKEGYLNATAEVNKRGMTDRAPAGEMRRIGDADVLNISSMVNAELPLSEKTSLYAFGGVNYRDAISGAWGREADDEDRNIIEIYPNGFVPDLLSNVWDHSIAVGITSEVKGWNIDLGHTHGFNSMDFNIDNTLNASMGVDSPTSFYAGKFHYQQFVTNLDVTKYFDHILEGFNLAIGAMHRAENYAIYQGEEASWKDYGNGKAAGAQGFPGYRPENEVNEWRSNVGVYIDTELDITKKWMIGAAARYENYSDFGGTLTGKFVTRYTVTDNWTLRGAISSGFRAPSLQQAYFNSTYTDFIGGEASEVVLARNDSELAKALGIPELKEETSVNYSLGTTWEPLPNLTITADAYLIDIKDRIVLTGYFSEDDEDISEIMQSMGVSEAAFFTNAIDTRTYGLDVVTTYSLPIKQNSLDFSLAVNHNVTEVQAVKTSDQLIGKEDIYFGERERYFQEGSAPQWKGNFSTIFKTEKWNAMARVNYFGAVTLGGWTEGFVMNYDPKATTDISFTYHPTDKWNWTVGGSNIFNVYPDKQDPYETDNGGYWDPVQMGFNGAYWYTRVSYSF